MAIQNTRRALKIKKIVVKLKPKPRNKKLVMVSGGFDPIHIGHLRMFEEAKKLGDELVVVINCDSWLMRKKGRKFMSSEDRAEIIRGFKCVDHVYVLESERNDVGEAIEHWKPHIFANGGDRKDEKDIPETEVCKKYNVQMIFNVGHGGKVRSSSDLLKMYEEAKRVEAAEAAEQKKKGKVENKKKRVASVGRK